MKEIKKEVVNITDKKENNELKKFLINVAKRIIFIALIYVSFSFQLSFVWLLSLVLLLAYMDEQKKTNERKHYVKRAANLISEQDAVLARIKELPAWVIFPDVDRAEWLNKVIIQIWPSVNIYFVKMLRTSVQSKINKKFESFKFKEIELGYIPPRIVGIKVYDKMSHKSEIIIDFSVFYDGDCDINFTLYGTTGSIKDLQMDVEMRVVLKPIITKMPLIGGIQIFFLNKPDIDLNLDGIASIPGLGYFIKKKIVEMLSKKLVFPNKIPIKLSKSVDSAELKLLEPEGVLRVHVVEAVDLERKDVNVLGIGKSDPYAILTVGAQELKTKVISNTTEPKWDFWCEFSILDPTVQHLDVEVFDHDLKSHDFLGSTCIDITSVIKEEQTDQWITLEKAKHGKIHLRFTWLTLSSNYSDLSAAIEEKRLLQVQQMSTALLTVFVDFARDLPHAKSFKTPDPFIILTVGNISLKSKTKKHTVDPVWEEGFSFLISDPESDSLYITIVDKHTGNTLDQLCYQIHNLVDKQDLEVSREELKLTKGGEDSKLVLSLQLRIVKKSNDFSSEEESSTSEGDLTRENSIKSKINGCDEINQFISTESKKEISEVIESKYTSKVTSPSLQTAKHEVLHRCSSTASSTGEAGLGRIQLTLRYSIPRQKLIIVVHKIENLPLKDPTNIPDPYVKLQLLPQAAGDKQKTRVIMDNCNPVFDETFEYLISQGELHKQHLTLTVKTKTKFSLSNHFMGQTMVELDKLNLTQAFVGWFDLMPETSQ